MDIVAIESKTFEQMKGRFEDFTRQIKNLCGENQDKEKWLGNDDVCSLLQISPRTLQSYRDNLRPCLIRRLGVNVITRYRILRI